MNTSNTKTLNLSVAERFKATQILNGFKGSLSNLTIILDDIKKFPLSPEEITKVHGTVVPLPNGQQTVNWDASKEKDIEKDIVIDNFTLEFLKNTIKDMSEKGELGLGDEAILTLLAKLND